MKEHFTPTVVESALIVDVDPLTWKATVQTEYSDRTIRDVPWAFPYSHPEGEGMIFIPEPGTRCLLVTPSDDEVTPVILAFAPIHDGEGYSNGRPKMLPGDQAILTKEGAGIICRRGGVVEVTAGTAARRYYFAAGNLLRDVSVRYEHRNAAGQLFWGMDPQGRPIYKLRILREGTEEEAPIEVALGRLGTEAVRVQVRSPQGQFLLSLDKDGNLKVEGENAEGHFSTVTLQADKATLQAKEATLRASSLYISTPTASVDYGSWTERGSEKRIETAQIFLGSLAREPIVLGSSLIRALSIPWVAEVKDASGKTLIGTAKITPAGLLALEAALSRRVKAE